MWTSLALPLGLAGLALCAACGGSRLEQFVRTRAPIVALTHVRIIDGTGSPGKDDQTVVLENGRIGAIGPTAQTQVPSHATVFDLRNHTVIPGIVGMHEHLFYQIEPPAGPTLAIPAQATFAKLYLAAGVTTIRTAGAVDFSGDRRLKRLIDDGQEPGPTIHLTGPYLHAATGIPDPRIIANEVAAQADQGATSFKAYTNLRSSELRAAIQAAHERGLRVTGHLCAVGYRDAAAFGIDNLEHGLVMDTEFYSGKQPDECPNQTAVFRELLQKDVSDPSIYHMMSELVRRGVTITSTLAVIESFTARESALDARIPVLLASRVRQVYQDARNVWANPITSAADMWAGILRLEMQFERQFVAMGGKLMAGADPTGWGGTVAGFADQRELELLVEAGLSPGDAIRIATLNGAEFLNEADRIGTLEAGKKADLVVIRGNIATNISNVRNVALVFKNGVAYDPTELIRATEGTIGRYEFERILGWPFNLMFVSLLVALAAKVFWRRRRAVTPC